MHKALNEFIPVRNGVSNVEHRLLIEYYLDFEKDREPFVLSLACEIP